MNSADLIYNTLLPNPTGVTTLGVLTDTHIPDRSLHLSPKILPIFQAAHVSAILHAGDISTIRVLDELAEVAPVYAVRGNRDLFWRHPLPLGQIIQVGDIQVGLGHGHGGFRQYWQDKLAYLTQGYRVSRYRAALLAVFPQAQVIVYGHTHRPDKTMLDGHLFFNPGAGGSAHMFGYPPAIGLLHLGPGLQIETEIIPV